MIRVVIVEDEKDASDKLKEYMYKFSREACQPFNLQIFGDGESFLKNYKNDCDIVMLDIELPGLDGMETARKLREADEHVVILFVTNMAQYAVNGYEVGAIDFAVKPLSYADFSFKMNRAIRHLKKTRRAMINIVTLDSMAYIDVSDIFYVEVIRHYLIYHTRYGDYTSRGTMKEIEDRLRQYFFVRINYCYLVNLKYVQEIKGEDVAMACDARVLLKISRNRKRDFLDEVARYMGGLS